MSVKDYRTALRSFLLGDSGVSSAVGAGRVYPAVLPQGITADSIVYQRISDVGDVMNDGPSGLARPRIQVDSWSKTSDGANALALLVKNRLDGYRGVMGSGGSAINVQGVFFDSARDDYDSTALMHRVSQDYFLVYEER
jgi:hypothetical protein